METVNCPKGHSLCTVFFILKYDIFSRQINQTLRGLDFLQLQEEQYLPYKFCSALFSVPTSTG